MRISWSMLLTDSNLSISSSRTRFANHRSCIENCKAWWRHQMETFSALLALCAGNSPVSDEFPTQRPVTRNLMFYLICVWINGWVSKGEAGDLRHYRAHYDVSVMVLTLLYDFGHGISECIVQMIFHSDQDDEDTKDVLLAKEEYCTRVLSILFLFGLNDNIHSLNINLMSNDF